MGLDVYFHSKPVYKHVKKKLSDILTELSSSSNESLNTATEELYSYTVDSYISFKDCLSDIIKSYLIRNSYPSSLGDGELWGHS